MTPETFGLLTAFFFACGHALARAAMRYSDPRTTALMNAVGQALVVWTLALILSPASGLWSKGMWFFALDGLMVPAIGRWLLFYGMLRVGMSRAASISGIAPFFTLAVAVLFLNERLTMVIAGATAAIVFGVYFVSKRKEKTDFQIKYVIYPLAAALVWGLSPNIRKLGLEIINYPMLGAAVSVSVSVLMMLIVVTFSGGVKSLKLNLRGIFFQLLSGTAHAVAILFYVYGLNVGKVVIVTPLANSTPLFSLPLALIFFRAKEGITISTVLGTFLIVLGIFALFAR